MSCRDGGSTRSKRGTAHRMSYRDSGITSVNVGTFCATCAEVHQQQGVGEQRPRVSLFETVAPLDVGRHAPEIR